VAERFEKVGLFFSKPPAICPETYPDSRLLLLIPDANFQPFWRDLRLVWAD
jgi:hypothetical protein